VLRLTNKYTREGDNILRALRNIVLVKLDPKEEVTSGGIILAALAQEKAVMGEIISIGPGRYTKQGDRIPVDFEVGQRVLIRKYCGEILDKENNIMGVYEHDIEGVITEEDEQVAL
jgi:chaperonin GroES